MNRLFTLVAASLLMASPTLANQITEVDTAWDMFGSHKVIVERFDDPRVENVSCYVSYARTGGLMGSIGLAEDPSRFSIACRAVGPLTVTSDQRGSVQSQFQCVLQGHACDTSP